MRPRQIRPLWAKPMARDGRRTQLHLLQQRDCGKLGRSCALNPPVARRNVVLA